MDTRTAYITSLEMDWSSLLRQLPTDLFLLADLCAALQGAQADPGSESARWLSILRGFVRDRLDVARAAFAADLDLWSPTEEDVCPPIC